MTPLPSNTALILIDVQQGFDAPFWGTRNNPHAEDNMARLLAAWRVAGRPIVHVQHLSRNPELPLHPDHAGSAIKVIVQLQGDESVITKDVNSAFIGTNLEQRLREAGITTVVIVGLTTIHCVSTTARMAGNLGFVTVVVSDATAAFGCTGHDGKTYSADLMHEVALAELHNEFATVMDTETVLTQFG
ncbi:MAG: cysteine hydrolase [Anaerolineae bacterium]|nr:cysteine hydrolase [Anaerolineae bacterium]